MLPSALVVRFRLDVDDDQQPYLWSDDEVWGYLNDAHAKWARDIGGIRDASTVAVTQYAVAPGDEWITLHPSILKIRSARSSARGTTLSVLSVEDYFHTQNQLIRDFPVSTADFGWTGPIKSLITGMEDDRLRLVNIPTEADTILLVVERLPINTLATPAPTASPAAVTGIARVGSYAVVTTTDPHGLVGTSTVIISGADQSEYNGTFSAEVIGLQNFRIAVDPEAVTPATGTITWAPATEYPFEGVREEDQLDLLWWMKHLAYSKQDADTFDKEKAEAAEATHIRRVAKAKEAKERRQYTPRLMQYGGY